MFIISIKPSLKKVCITLASIFIIAFSITILIKDSNSLAASKLLSERTAEEKRISYIEKYGWQIDETPIESVSVKIPSDFSNVYKQYNKLQKSQGYNLEKYRGKTVTRYSYEVSNYKDNPKFVRINLLIYKDTIIASDICSLKLEGFMHELSNNKNATK